MIFNVSFKSVCFFFARMNLKLHKQKYASNAQRYNKAICINCLAQPYPYINAYLSIYGNVNMLRHNRKYKTNRYFRFIILRYLIYFLRCKSTFLSFFSKDLEIFYNVGFVCIIVFCRTCK